jgi:hypothetical protein
MVPWRHNAMGGLESKTFDPGRKIRLLVLSKDKTWRLIDKSS